MTDPYFQQLFAQRIGGSSYGKGTEIYKFEKIKRAKRKALAEHPERKLVDFGIGENDEMADAAVRRIMAEEINRPENRGYADNGIPAFKEAVARLSEATVEAAAAAEVELDEIDLFVYHQANGRITRALGERLGLAPDRVVDCIESLGNSSAATLPLALAEAERDGRLRRGAKVLLSAFGAGFTWGGGVIEWGGEPVDE